MLRETGPILLSLSLEPKEAEECPRCLLPLPADRVAEEARRRSRRVIFGVASALVVADRTRGTGRFNLAQGALASFVVIGASLSTTYGGYLIRHFEYNASFLGPAAVGAVARQLLFAFFPATCHEAPSAPLPREELALNEAS